LLNVHNLCRMRVISYYPDASSANLTLMKNLSQLSTTQELKILLVEDDWTVRGAVRDFLSKRAMNVAEASCMEEALAVAEVFIPDVAVIDIVVPSTAEARADFDKNVEGWRSRD